MRNYRARTSSAGPVARRRGRGNDRDERITRAAIYQPERDEREVAVLRLIAEAPLTIEELRERLGHTAPGTGRRLAERLTEEGLVERGRRGRLVEFRVTDAGREVLAS